ncbi:MAG TPA: amino acid adenylation domain-containing protein, partial [Thermoanaerobaculia bacterium]|nr:amino acid adenylation domain-containing protein [Thermoanaerobaculia bacterium]
MTEARRHQLLVEWNDTEGPDPGQCLFALFTAQAQERGDAVAVVSGEEELTYAELWARAAELAVHLRALGVGPEVAVGLGLERSPRAVTAMLAVLAAGGAFVPLDPSYPAERLRQMAGDAALRLLLTDGATAGRLPDLPGARTVRLDGLGGPGLANGEPPAAGVTADNLAYVMFTSGSTGRPKGVAVTHRAVVRLVRGAGYARLDAGETFLQYAPLSFDASTLEIWGSLLNGGRLVIPPAGRASLEDLGREIARHGVTSAWLTAGLFHQMVESHLDGLRPLRQLLAGGDVLSPPHVRRALAELPGLTLINGYGPTENTTFTCCHSMSAPPPADSPVPIGRPVTGTRVLLLDGALELVPAGVTGELYAGGHGLARGYAGRPELTAERFVPHPSPPSPGERLYRTGDLARWRPDGTIEFLGRADQQVKVRGFRVEPGEIEAVLQALPGVRAAAVVAREDTGGDKTLAAYVVPEPGGPLAPDALRSELGRRLPEFMVPTAWMLLEALPLTANGKVDRRALPAPGPGAAAYRAPRTPAETALAEIWAEVLGVERVGLDDDFFALGGHSLRAAQVVSRLRAALGVELPLQALFEAPGLAGAAERVAEALGRDGRADLPPLLPVPRDGAGLPLSFPQRRLWFLHRLDPASPVYNLPLGWRLRGELNAGALAASLAAVVGRHEALRTVFAGIEGEPVQVVLPAAPLALPVVDLSGLDEPVRAAEARRLDGAAARAPFDLAAGPMMRARLLVLGPEEHALLLDLHHIATDGWSMGVLARELEALYAGETLPALPVQYADFAHWQRQWMASGIVEEQLGYWRQRLAGLAPLELPADRPRPPVQSFRGAALSLPLPPGLTRALRDLSRRQGATLFMTLLAAFALLLRRTSGQDDLAVGAPAANRGRREVEGLIGFFINSLVLRLDLSGEPGFRGLLGRVRETALGAYAHPDVPFERLVEELQPARDASRNPLFQVLFQVLDAALPPPLTLAGLDVEPLPRSAGTARFDLELAFHETAGELAGLAELSSDLFDATTIQRLLGQYQRLLEGIVAAPEARLSDLPLLGEAERQQLLVEWNDTGGPLSGERLLHEPFAAQAARTPEAVAVIAGDGSLTYGELHARAARLASHLGALGLEPEARVGIFLDRSLDLVVAILAVLRAGGAYLPLDPAYPKERLAFTLEDSAARGVITRESLLGALPGHGGWQVLVDRDAAAVDAAAEAPPAPALADGLAYLIYTSGSTGRPKGVAIRHASAVELVEWSRGVFSAAEVAGVLASTSICFDLSVFELFVPLSRGGCVILAADALALPSLPARHLVTLVNSVPSALTELVRMGGLPPSVATVNLAGEPLQRSLVNGIYRQGGVRKVYNLYGPSEDTTYSTFTLVGREGGAPAIGVPLAATRAYVLDREMGAAPVGVAGELHLAGAGLARGYLGRPDLTAERFVPSPWGAPGERLYRTGDLASFLPDGGLKFLGRIDHQVKIRGFRIELGEIEAALSRCPGLRESVVVAAEEPGGGKRLVAYVAPGSAPAAPELRSFLRRTLPEHMVPAVFVHLEALPLTPNGKVDRRALPAPEADRDRTQSFIAPRTATEELLAGIWSELLGAGAISVEDSFFELGGHSLLATQAVSRVRERLGVDLGIRALFASPRLGALAARIDDALRSGGNGHFPVVTPVPRDGELPASFAQQRMFFVDQLAPGNPFYNLPLTFRLSGPVSMAALELTFGEIVRRHEALRTRFVPRGGRLIQEIAPPAPWRLPEIDLRALPAAAREDEERRLAAFEGRLPFDLRGGPVLRTLLVRSGGEDAALLATLHHIAGDGWSLGVLTREMTALYAAFRQGRPSPLPPLAVQYADFSWWQRQWLQGEVLEAEAAYWRQQLAGAPTVLELPADRPRPAFQAFRGDALVLPLPSALAAALGRVGRRAGTTLFMTLLAGFQALLHRATGQASLLLGLPIANRHRGEIEPLIGCFINVLALRSDLAAGGRLRDLLAAARSTALAAYAHQELPFDCLVEELQPARDMSRNPIVQVLFQLLNTPAPPLVLEGAAAAGVERANGTSRLDLELTMREVDGRLEALAEYDTDLFDRPSVLRLMARYQLVLEQLAEDGDRLVAAIELLSGPERHQALLEWNDTRAAGGGPLVHELFAAQAARRGDAVALELGGRSLSYRRLDAEAERLARHLRGLGVGPEVRVGLLMERSPEMVIALLGILKAGGAYLPLDPGFPKERLAFMLADAYRGSRSRVLVTHGSLPESFPELAAEAERVVRLPLEIGLEEGPGGAIHPQIDPENLAYVMYTSGSTGRPKGVQIPHRAVAGFLASMRERPGLTEDDVLLAVTTLSFDISVLEIFLPLCLGARVALAGRETAADGEQLLRALEASGATAMQATPATWRLLLQAGWRGGRGLKVLCGGEALPRDVADRLLERSAGVWNLYGPTETTV